MSNKKQSVPKEPVRAYEQASQKYECESDRWTGLAVLRSCNQTRYCLDLTL